MTTPKERRPWTWHLAVGLLAGLVIFSVFLALTRIYQVDEAQNVFTARILASHWEKTHNLWIEIWHLWPLAWLASRFQDSTSLFHASRLFMLVVFWSNILLTAMSCGVSWRSKTFVWVLLGAATLAPLWDYGFEIRHDNLLLLLLLLYFRSFRMESDHFRRRSFLLGMLTALLQLITLKALVYWLPLALLFLIIPPKTWGLSRSKTFLFGCLGFLSVIGLVVGLLRISGRLPFMIDSFAVAMSLATKGTGRFPPWGTFSRLLYQTPMLLGVALAAFFHTAASLSESWRERCSWEGLFPEAFLLLTTSLVLLVHPMPLPYHLCLVVPFAYILGIKWMASIQAPAGFGGSTLFLVTGLAVFTHLAPFASATLRHLDFTNDRQERLMTLAETMTDPARDRVYDAAGLVASRESIGKQWFLHTLFLDRFARGELPPVRQMLQERPASVLLPNYRFTWLQAEDVAFIQSNYLPLSNDFMVLGRTLQPPHLEFPCLQPGRYYITSTTLAPRGTQGVLDMDGVRIPIPSVQTLSTGLHVFRSEQEVTLIIGWLGPKLDQLPKLDQGDAKRLFINWY